MRFGASGAQLIWGGEAFAVRPDGRANPNQLAHGAGADTPASLASLRDALREGAAALDDDPDALVVGLQLTHSGRFARAADGSPRPRIAFRHPLLDERVGIRDDGALLSDAELDDLIGRYVALARLAQAAGFDFVDVKACHGYLVHELLAARTRPGRYGGDLAGRARFLLETVDAIRAGCPGLGIGVRLSAGDVIPHRGRNPKDVGRPEPWAEGEPYLAGFGVDAQEPTRFDLREPLELLGWLAQRGVREVSVSLGSPYACPHLQRPAAYPPSDGYQPPEDPLAGVAAHLRLVRACKRAHPGLVLVGAGYTYLQEWLPQVAQHELRHGHVDLVGLGRMVLSYPTLPRDVLSGKALDRRRVCRTFSDCTTAPRNGLPSGCYPLDSFYADRPEARRVAAIKEQRRGR
jgi:2,4-dienoyl-CoA reductase-like NADH-dependent reductase (Old Yellow Enzyme family)